MCTRESLAGRFSEPVNLGPTVNTSSYDAGPFLSANGLTLLFHSNRPNGEGREDLWMCMRASPTEPFGEPVNLGPTFNSNFEEGKPALSTDGLTLLFNASRPGGQGGWDLWTARIEQREFPSKEKIPVTLPNGWNQ